MEKEEKMEQNNKLQWAVLVLLLVAYTVTTVPKNVVSGTIHVDVGYPILFLIVFLLYLLIGKLNPIKVLKICGVNKPKAAELLFYSVGVAATGLVVCSLILPKVLNINVNEVLKITGYYSRYGRYSIMSMTDSKLLVIVSLAAFYVYQTFFEELIFRGIILRKLLSKYNFWISNIIHAVIFGSVHIISVLMIPNPPMNMKIFMFVSPTIGGLLLGYAYAKTDNNLTVSWLPHFLVNLTPDLLFILFGITIMPT